MNRFRWLIALIAQCIICLLIGLIIALSMWLGGRLHTILSWTVLPLTGAVCACLATILGLNNYIAWLVPPSMAFAAHIIAWGYAPGIAPILVCALISVVGAAAGEVIKRQNNDRQRGERHYGKRADSDL